MTLENLAPPGVMRFSVVACPNCETKYVSPEQTDNEYFCRREGCNRINLMGEPIIQYDALESEVAEFLHKNYKGKNIGSRNGA